MHLSTRMCAAHRLERIAEVKRRLDLASEPCLLVSTQLVEAGVDLDFPLVYRAMGPLDSIAQSAGRCDREGKLTAAAQRPAGKLIVFRTEDEKTPPGAYREATDLTSTLAADGELSIDNPDHIRKYFDRLYGEADLGRAIEDHRKNMRFREIARQFQMIAENTQAVFVPYNSQARALIANVQAAGVLVAPIRRKLQRYLVGLYPEEFKQARHLGVIDEIRPESDLWVCKEGFYDHSVGLVIQPAPATMVV